MQTVRLDDFLPGASFDTVIMDIEGSECLALRGMRDILAGARMLSVEFIPYNLRHVSGTSPVEFAALLEPHFDSLFIPTRNARVTSERFREVLADMYARDEEDASLLFEKTA